MRWDESRLVTQADEVSFGMSSILHDEDLRKNAMQ